MSSVSGPLVRRLSPTSRAYAGFEFDLNANYKRHAQHHVLPNCGRKPAPSSCERTPRLPPELLPEDLWWAHSPGCPPRKEVRSALGEQPHDGTKESDIILRWQWSSAWLLWCSAERHSSNKKLSPTKKDFFHVRLESGAFYLIGNNDISQFVNPA